MTIFLSFPQQTLTTSIKPTQFYSTGTFWLHCATETVGSNLSAEPRPDKSHPVRMAGDVSDMPFDNSNYKRPETPAIYCLSDPHKSLQDAQLMCSISGRNKTHFESRSA